MLLVRLGKFIIGVTYTVPSSMPCHGFPSAPQKPRIVGERTAVVPIVRYNSFSKRHPLSEYPSVTVVFDSGTLQISQGPINDVQHAKAFLHPVVNEVLAVQTRVKGVVHEYTAWADSDARVHYRLAFSNLTTEHQSRSSNDKILAGMSRVG